MQTPSSSVITASYTKYPLTFKKPAGTSRGYLYHQENFFVRLTDSANADCFGLGECGPLVGLSVDDRSDFEAQLARICTEINQGRIIDDLSLDDFPSIAFGLEAAHLDLQHGGNRQLFETPFSRGKTTLPTHGLIWMADKEGLLNQIQQKIKAGFTCIKLKVGALDFEEECAVLNTIRQVCPPAQIELRLDANGAFSPESAIAKLETLAQFDIQAIEQPIKPGQWRALANLCANSPIAIALDEELIGIKTDADRRALLETTRPQYLVLKPMLIGGFSAADRWIKLAESLGIGWWVNSALEANIGLNAIAQWASSLKSELTHGLGTGQLYTNNISAPIRLTGNGLIYDHDIAWDISNIFDN